MKKRKTVAALNNAKLVERRSVFPIKSSVRTNNGDSEKNGAKRKSATTPNE
jgi:LysM repeat protein